MEIVEPKEATAFQPAKKSGTSLTLLGIPAKPTTCIAKKIQFTATKKTQKFKLANT
jgi:hypothetical protein